MAPRQKVLDDAARNQEVKSEAGYRRVVIIRSAVSVDVADLHQAVQFYTGALGCEVARAGDETTLLAAGEMPLYLLKRDVGAKPFDGSPTGRSYERHWTPVHLDFSVDDFDAVVAAVLKHGGTHEGGESGDWGSIAYCADPFGNGFCVIATEHA